MRQSTSVIIDCHAHVIAHDRPITSHRHAQPSRSHTPEELLAIYDENDVSQGLLTAPSFYLTDNSLLLEALAKFPRFKGTATLAPDTTSDEMEALRTAGVCGARLNWFRKPELPDIAVYRAFMARLREVGLHLELYVEGQFLPRLLPTILESRVQLVLDHFGSPDPKGGVQSEGFLQMITAMNAGLAWVKLSAPYRLQGDGFEKLAEEYARSMIEQAGPERLLWGSDWPWTANEDGMTYARCLDWLTQWVPEASHRDLILCETPRTLFGFA